jgi:DNA-binding NtrC family response regulator
MEALRILPAFKPDVALVDMSMPQMDGFELLENIKNVFSHTEVVMMTAFGSEEIAVNAMKKGAYDYIPKPFNNDELLLIVKKACEKQFLQKKARELHNANIELRKELEKKFDFNKLIGVSPMIQNVYSIIERISDSDITVLITGASGTGKEVVANTVHYNSMRKEGPFIKINCASIPDDLLESELFGYEKGAFTGAYKLKPGKFELAHRGTLFLDEIGDMSLSTQAKILRVIQHCEFERLGGKETLNADVRIIAATNRDLKERIKQGLFRQDLFYRLNVINIKLSGLAERREDIPILVNHFIKKINSKFKKNFKGLSRQALQVFLEYSWPGNIREMINVLEYSIIMSPESEYIDLEALPQEIGQLGHKKGESFFCVNPGESYNQAKKRVLQEFEKNFIIQALLKCRGNIALAAKESGMYRANFYKKMQKYNIKVDKLKEISDLI